MTAPRLYETVIAGPATVVEASAGTGKTYQLEHLVLELVSEGHARIDELLVVTFTDRAAAELVTRIRATIDRGLTAGGTAAARARLVEARRSLDQASITTIHAFCQRLLTDEPLSTGRLLTQQQVDGSVAFGAIFRDLLRTTLVTDARLHRFLAAYLDGRRGVGGLEALLFRASTARGRWAFPFGEADLRATTAALATIDWSALERLWKPALGHAASGTAFRKRAAALWPAFEKARGDDDWLGLLDVLDDHADEKLAEYVEKLLLATATPAGAALAPLARGLERLLRTPGLEEAIVQALLPTIADAVDRHKLGRGLFDFDDMIASVARALDDETRGPALADKLRRRFRYAIIDEAQDTEHTQWRIFERIFLQSNGANPLVLVGDPKQAIYGFRGADVHTYVAARTAIQARGGAALVLDRNFRSTPEVVSAVNAVLEHDAAPAYFTDPGIAYDHPVASQREARGDGPGVTLFQLHLRERPEGKLPVGRIKRALRRAIAQRIFRLTREQPGLRLSSIFVLTRSRAEGREISVELDDLGIAHGFYKQEGLWQRIEVEHVRALLLAIDDPEDRMARLHAWMTPFFGATLRELNELGEPPAHHPYRQRLYAWKALADARDYPALWTSVFESGGLGARHLLARPSRRRLGLYRQIADALLAEAAARPLSPGELATALGRFAAGELPANGAGAARDLDLERPDVEDDAVQIMTMHRSKGLEAEHVFLYGALTNVPIRNDQIHAFRDGDERVFCAGKPRLPAALALIKAHRDQEDQRLLYVAMTRARDHLYMPFFPDTETGEVDVFGSVIDHGDYVAFDKITGAYRHVNQRLRALALDGARFGELFAIESVPFPAPDRAVPPELAAELGAWAPPQAATEVELDPRALARLRAQRRGFVITSYSRLKEAEGAIEAPVLDENDGGDEIAAVAEAPPAGTEARAGEVSLDDLPGGAATGLFLHSVLEKVALGPLPPFEEWSRAVEVQQRLEVERRRWERDPRALGPAARIVHAALTTPLALPGAAPLPGLARAARVRREVDFLFPVAPALADASTAVISSRDDRLIVADGFIRGVLDVLFEHDGRVWFADWKSDVLPDYTAATVGARVDASYDLQIQIYTVAVARLLGVRDARDYDQRFGGLAYVFLRGLGAATSNAGAILIRRPSYDDVRAWERALVRITGGSSDATGASLERRP